MLWIMINAEGNDTQVLNKNSRVSSLCSSLGIRIFLQILFLPPNQQAMIYKSKNSTLCNQHGHLEAWAILLVRDTGNSLHSRQRLSCKSQQ